MKNFRIKQKIINHFILKGKKHTSENIIKNSIKKLQKQSLKSTQKIIKQAIILATPLFKINKKQSKKKRTLTKTTPSFISNYNARISLGIKLILFNFHKNLTYLTYKNVNQQMEIKRSSN